MKLLLDTHVFIWWQTTRKELELAQPERSRVDVCQYPHIASQESSLISAAESAPAGIAALVPVGSAPELSHKPPEPQRSCRAGGTDPPGLNAPGNNLPIRLFQHRVDLRSDRLVYTSRMAIAMRDCVQTGGMIVDRRGVGTGRIGKLLPGAFSPGGSVPPARQDR